MRDIVRRLVRKVRSHFFNSLRLAIAHSPANPEPYRALAKAMGHAGYRYAANALLRSAAFLDGDITASSKDMYQITDSELISLNHNQHFRFQTIAKCLLSLDPSGRFSVLDIGGGHGQLAQFLPDADYFLVEPGVTGIGSHDLPFSGRTFDYVVCCHVLEHIPMSDREAFLESLMSIARKGLIILNPFKEETLPQEEALHIFIDLLNAGWAKEHLDCTLPQKEELSEWANKKGYHISFTPNGFMPFTVATEFVERYAGKLGRRKDLATLNRFFNERFSELLDSDAAPTAWLATILISENVAGHIGKY